eukprot:GILK01005822.1.p1 GENE.GILK01005822.1~~GILK01005822.1.p1  ORF type:complete len:313 (-),score=38.59 GILK01005822.1:177-1064(-)
MQVLGLRQCIQRSARRFFSAVRTPLEATPNIFRSQVVNEHAIPESTVEFADRLKLSVDEWKRQGIKGIWLKLLKSRAHLLGTALDHGFEMHHAQPEYVMLTSWLAENEKNRLPSYATASVGVGGFVLREDTDQILVIAEKVSFDSSLRWKMPGGQQDVGETLPAAAIREVWEETGIKTAFQSIIGFRHVHNFRHGMDDFYFLVRLTPLTFDINPCPNEIAAAQWIDRKDLLADNLVYPLQQAFFRMGLDRTCQEREWKQTKIRQLPPFGRQQNIYHPAGNDIDLFRGLELDSSRK